MAAALAPHDQADLSHCTSTPRSFFDIRNRARTVLAISTMSSERRDLSYSAMPVGLSDHHYVHGQNLDHLSSQRIFCTEVVHSNNNHCEHHSRLIPLSQVCQYLGLAG